ncbi:outer membrane beta-barrel protein [Carboxylicivirga sp. RSCT41]|uniref:outer membrane beta-barrel protein n=1 Tax=Carboxylicivirga agarovorans TaxID=3417570 RepID=UPI003D3359EB
MKYSLFLFFVFIITTDICSQENKRLNYQINAGTSLSVPHKKKINTLTMTEDQLYIEYSAAFGYFLEIMASYDLTEKSYLMTGFNYNTNTTSIYEKAGAIENKGEKTTSYINVPLLFGLRSRNMSLAAGPYLGFVIRAKEKGTIYIDTTGLITLPENESSSLSIDPVQDYDRDMTGSYKSIATGLSAQIDYTFKLSDKLNGVFLTRFNYGLTSVLEEDELSMLIPDYWKDHSVIFGFGIKL